MKQVSWGAKGVVALAVLSVVGPPLAGCQQKQVSAAPPAAGPGEAMAAETATDPSAPTAVPHGTATMPWVKSWDVAMKQTKATGRPILIDFYADWCGWCKKLDSDVYTDPQVVKAAADFIPIKLDVEKDGRDVALKYASEVSHLPAILFVDSEGKLEGKIGGYVPAPQFAELMGEMLALHREIPSLKERFKTDPTDLKAAAKLTSVYAQQDDTAGASASFDRVLKLDPANAQGYLAKSAITVGQMYASANDFKKAVPLFQRAVQVARTPEETGYGRLNLAVSYLAQNDLKAAKSQLQATADDPKVDAESKEKAKNLLARLAQAEQQQAAGATAGG